MKNFVLTLWWWSAPLRHEWSAGGLHVSGKEGGISKEEAHQGLVQHLSEHQGTEVDEFTKIHRGERADTGGCTAQDSGTDQADGQRDVWEMCIYTPIFAVNCLTNNLEFVSLSWVAV